MKCEFCKSKNTVKYIDDLFWMARCAYCGRHWPIKSPRRLPYGRIALICVVLALVVLIAFLPISRDFYGQGCNINGCVERVYTTTRPAWLWVWGGGW